jgi:hypothetical protein
MEICGAIFSFDDMIKSTNEIIIVIAELYTACLLYEISKSNLSSSFNIFKERLVICNNKERMVIKNPKEIPDNVNTDSKILPLKILVFISEGM